ncbi:GntR family transcriptional regulator [Sulfitobacter sp. LCG007]
METPRASQTVKARDALRTLILTGAFAPGERLPEPVISDRLRVSRTPLREAMSQLVDEGIVERLPTGGCRVSSYSMQDIVDAIEVRGTLEGLAVRLAAERGVPTSEIAACAETLGRIDDALARPGGMEFGTYVRLNAEFHRRIVGACNSPVVIREVERAWNQLLASPSAFLHGQEDSAAFRASLLGAQRHHRTILEAVEAREGARAEATAREHARLARQNLRAALEAGSGGEIAIPGLQLVAPDPTWN